MKRSVTRGSRRWAVVVFACLVAAVSAVESCHAADALQAGTELPWGATPSGAQAYARAADIANLGHELFNDPMLSASGQVACSTCHDPSHGFSAPNAAPVQVGGRALDRPGIRAAPGLTYAQFSPPFSEHFFESDEDGDESVDQGPTGGLDWDGRVDRARDQVRRPLLDPSEMANVDLSAVAFAASRSGYAETIRLLYGQDVFADPARTFAAIAEALEFYLQTPAEFGSYSSKYDAYLRGRADLTPREKHGLALFDDPAKGNCAQCHRSAVTADGKPPLFTDFGYAALGLPRNPAIPANAAPDYSDLGLCGPARRDLTDRASYCGMFKTPSLRNVALKQSLFHNGVVHSLRDAVAFYVQRDTDPARWYPTTADGTVRKFDDLPAQYMANVSMEPPFGGHAGDPPTLSPAEIDDVVTFLRALTDGYPGAGAFAGDDDASMAR